MRLKDITEKIGSGATPKGGKNTYLGGDISLIRSQNVLDYEFSNEGLALINDEQASKLDNVTVREGDVLLNITGDSVARCCLVPKDVLPARENQHVSIIRPKGGISSDYLMYWLLHMKRHLLNICRIGGTRNALTKEALEELEIEYSDDARSIACVLRTLDNKIANNKKIIKELEETARLIYDFWFTQFDFPDENRKPYRSSGGKMVWSDELKREIPEGWEAADISLISRYVQSAVENIKLTRNTYISTDNMISDRGGITDSQYLPESGSSTEFIKRDTLLSNIRPYFKKILLADRAGGCCNDVLVIRPNNLEDWAFLYWTLESESFFAYDNAGSKGSKMPRGDKEHIMRFPIAIPPRFFRSRFTDTLDDITTMSEEKTREINELKRLRDWLLPMLMNGQAVINE